MRSTMLQRLATAGFVLAVGGAMTFGVVAVAASSNDSSSNDSSNSADATLADPDRPDPGVRPDEGPAIIEAAPGWSYYGLDPATRDLGPGNYRPRGVVRSSDLWDASGEPFPVYDQPDGAVVGYAAKYVTFVDKATFEAPGFDLETYTREQVGDAELEKEKGKDALAGEHVPG